MRARATSREVFLEEVEKAVQLCLSMDQPLQVGASLSPLNEHGMILFGLYSLMGKMSWHGNIEADFPIGEEIWHIQDQWRERILARGLLLKHHGDFDTISHTHRFRMLDDLKQKWTFVFRGSDDDAMLASLRFNGRWLKKT